MNLITSPLNLNWLISAEILLLDDRGGLIKQTNFIMALVQMLQRRVKASKAATGEAESSTASDGAKSQSSNNSNDGSDVMQENSVESSNDERQDDHRSISNDESDSEVILLYLNSSIAELY